MTRFFLCVLWASAVCSAFATDMLVSREGCCIERWQISEKGMTRVGVFADAKRVEGFKPTGIAVAPSGIVYAGDAGGGGRIVMFGADGSYRGILATLGTRPDNVCFSPDGQWLFVSQVMEHRLFRYSTVDGRGGEYGAEGLSGPRGMAFGPDGLLYVACRVSRCVRVYDVSGACGVLRGTIATPLGFGGLAFGGAAGERLIVSGGAVELIDLSQGCAAPLIDFAKNAFAACAFGNAVYLGDWTSGDIFRVDPLTSAWTRVGDSAKNVMAMAIVGDNGAAARRAAFRQQKLSFRLHTPVLPQSDNDFSRLKFNNPTAVTWLKGGFSGDLRVKDYDNDGQLDILVYSGWEGQVWEGCWFFRNPTPKGRKDADPVFEAPVRVPRSAMGDSVGPCHFADGSLVANVLSTNQCYERRQLIDYDGDGRDDLVIAASVRVMAIWDNTGYDKYGIWTKPQMHGYLFWCRGLEGKGAAARYGKPQIVRLENGEPMTTSGWNPTLIRDWDGDGDLDVIMCDYNDTFLYFENTGTRTKPIYAAGCYLRYPDGGRLAGYQCQPSVEAVDWDGDGLVDIMRVGEESRVYWYRNTGKLARGLPVFERPRFFRQRAGDLCSSALSTPWAFDWDGDDDQDILSGDTAGTLDFYENLSGVGVEKPKWAPPRKMTTPDGKPVRILAGPSGSLQGPIEAMYGYTTLSVNDWDGDGLPDLMVNTIWGKVVWFKNIGTRTQPKLDFARDVEVAWKGPQPAIDWNWFKPEMTDNPKALIIPWRTTPVMIDLNGDGLMDLAAMDVEGDLAYYERARAADGSLILKHPRKAFLRADGKPFLLAYDWLGGPANRWSGHIGLGGRRKFCFCDWDGDGLLDIVMNGGSNAEWWRQLPREGDVWRFDYGGRIGMLDIATHDPQPCACDFNADGKPDIIVGAMDGYFYYRRNPRSK